MSLHVVIIDDEVSCLKVFGTMLTMKGYTVSTFEAGQEGLEFIQDNATSIGAVLLDYMLPDISGIDILQSLKSHPTAISIPVIFQSGYHDGEDIEKARVLGAVAVLAKPYGIEQLLEVLQPLCV